MVSLKFLCFHGVHGGFTRGWCLQGRQDGWCCGHQLPAMLCGVSFAPRESSGQPGSAEPGQEQFGGPS